MGHNMGEARIRGSRDQRVSIACERKTLVNQDHKAASDFLSKGIALEAHVLEHSEKIREQSKYHYPSEWLDARLILLSIAKHLIDAKSLVPGRTSEEIAHILVLLMTFLQGTSATEILISEGQYIKAAAALKQDYEIIARISEVRAGTAKPGQTPQIKHLADEVKKYYGELNRIAHPSNQESLIGLMGTLVSGESNAISYIPVFHKESSLGLYELHVWLILMATQEYLRLFVEMYDFEESTLAEPLTWLLSVKNILEKVGFKFE